MAFIFESEKFEQCHLVSVGPNQSANMPASQPERKVLSVFSEYIIQRRRKLQPKRSWLEVTHQRWKCQARGEKCTPCCPLPPSATPPQHTQTPQASKRESRLRRGGKMLRVMPSYNRWATLFPPQRSIVVSVLLWKFRIHSKSRRARTNDVCVEDRSAERFMADDVRVWAPPPFDRSFVVFSLRGWLEIAFLKFVATDSRRNLLRTSSLGLVRRRKHPSPGTYGTAKTNFSGFPPPPHASTLWGNASLIGCTIYGGKSKMCFLGDSCWRIVAALGVIIAFCW